MIKVAMIGAGSVVFSKNLTGDLLSYPEFKNATFSYMDVDPERLEVGVHLCDKVARALGADPVIEGTIHRRKALAGADFVINMVQIGGFDSTLVDFEIPRKYGLNFTIADTTGPGGFFRALRTFPMLTGLCRDMEAVCPDAVLLNYSNPMSMNMHTVFRTSGVRAVGLCHSVQGTFSRIMRDIGEDPAGVAFTCAGINHMAFFLRLEKDGVDLYPRLFAAADDPRIYETNRVRYELLKRLGYFVTESSEHHAEYSPYFIPHGKEQIECFDVPIDEYLRRCDGVVHEFERLQRASRSDEPLEVHRSQEYGSTIIHSMATGQPSVIYGNVVNRGAISSLPATAIVEVPTLVDRAGLQPTVIGELPPQLAGYMNPHITQQELFIRAAVEGRRDHVYQAAMFDPLTAAMLPPDKIVELCDELIAAHGELLPPLKKETLIPTSGRQFGRVDPQALRAAWEASQPDRNDRPICEWHVVGPFHNHNGGPVTIQSPTAVENGPVDLQARFCETWREFGWQPLAAEDGRVELERLCGPADRCTAYAYTEIMEPRGRETVLRLGSHAGIRLWLNGEEVYAHESRGYRIKPDEVPVRLKEGVNRILVKVVKDTGPWGFTLTAAKN